MSKIKSIIVAAIATATLASPALATGTLNVVLPTTQAQWADVFANLNLYGKWIDGDVTATVAAMGNNLSVDSAASTYVHIDQHMMAEVGATLNSGLKGVGGDVDLSAIGICNNASVTASGGGSNIIGAGQYCNTFDPFAVANVVAQGVGGDYSVTAASMANNMVADVTGNLNGTFVQRNVSAVYANVNAAVADVGGNVTAQAIAIGNNLSIKQGY